MPEHFFHWFTADRFAAIGTVGAVIVALFQRPFDAWLQRQKRPVLLMELHAEQDGQTWDLAAKVSNIGKNTATNVRIQTQRCEFHADFDDQWRSVMEFPFPLCWASRRDYDSGRDVEVVDLPSKMADFAFVSRVDDAHGRVHSLWRITGDKLIDTKGIEDVGEYRITVAVFADNAEPVSRVISYRREQVEYGPHALKMVLSRPDCPMSSNV